jgi:glycine betaine/choline ABC-type transport system substrate-binding protein
MQTVRAPKVVALVIAAAVLGGCSRPRRPLTVGAKDSTEQAILAEVVAQHLEKQLQLKVQRQTGMAGTLMAHQALISGQIDVYPEYAGAALAVVLKLDPVADADIAQERVKREYVAQQLVWMDPLGFDRRFVMVTGPGDAGKITTLSEASQYRQGWTIGAGREFMDRPGGYPALMRTYDLPVNGVPKILEFRSVYSALAAKQVTLVAGNATDGMLGSGGFKVLRDDQQAFPPDRAALVARAVSLQAHPGMQEALGQLAGKFPDDTMRKLNYEVDGRRRPVLEVAREFLAQAGL